MIYSRNDYVYVISFHYIYRMKGRRYTGFFSKCWCKILSYNYDSNTYDVITENGIIQKNVSNGFINDKRTLQQGKNTRIKKLERIKI